MLDRIVSCLCEKEEVAIILQLKGTSVNSVYKSIYVEEVNKCCVYYVHAGGSGLRGEPGRMYGSRAKCVEDRFTSGLLACTISQPGDCPLFTE